VRLIAIVAWLDCTGRLCSSTTTLWYPSGGAALPLQGLCTAQALARGAGVVVVRMACLHSMGALESASALVF
jgi:hypothetical protein